MKMTAEDLIKLIDNNEEEFESMRFYIEFRSWLKKNSHLFKAFETYAKHLKAEGKREYYSARCILEKMRWDSLFREVEPTEFKINNNHGACLARLTMLKNPHLNGMFRLRDQGKGSGKAAVRRQLNLI